MARSFKPRVLATTAAAFLLGACGGGGGGDDAAPPSSGTQTLFSVSDASIAALNGDYGSRAIGLGAVEKRDLALCLYRFDTVAQLGNNVDLAVSGEVQFVAFSRTLLRLRLSIGNRDFVVDVVPGRPGVSDVDRDAGRVTFADVTAEAGSGSAKQTLRLRGFLPLPRTDVPLGC